MKVVMLFGALLLAGCAVTMTPQTTSPFAAQPVQPLDYKVDDDSEEAECRQHYRYYENLGVYNSNTAMDEQMREFWAEDAKFYREHARRHCKD
ncbi:MAG: hypothetical protein MI751_04175 [Pseudomonadales bacterium]|nr:hypothetical protein [Pseudomonadales bacterium]